MDKVLPEACTIPEEELEIIDHPIYDGEKQAKNSWTYSDTKVVPLLVKAIQELSTELNILQSQISGSSDFSTLKSSVTGT